MTPGLSQIKSILRPSEFRRSAGWIAFSVILSACAEITPVEFSHFDNFGSRGIPDGWVYDFNPVPADSADMGRALYDVVLTVRFNSRTSSRNLVLDVEEVSLEKMEPVNSRINLTLFSDEGKPLGTGNLGLFEISDTLHRAVPVYEGYSVAVSSPLPSSETVGINAVGVSLVRSGRKSPLDIPSPLN